jgi:hypothetical protein
MGRRRLLPTALVGVLAGANLLVAYATPTKADEWFGVCRSPTPSTGGQCWCEYVVPLECRTSEDCHDGYPEYCGPPPLPRNG